MSTLFNDGNNYILNRGSLIARACDRFVRTERQMRDLLEDCLGDRLTLGSRVGFHPHHARLFIQLVLPALKTRIVVVVVDDERRSQCHSFPPKGLFNAIEAPLVEHWFVENWQGGQPGSKVTCRPIGLSWNHISQAPLYSALCKEIDRAPSLLDKPLRVLANFQHLNHVRPASGELPHERRLLAEKLRGHPLIDFDQLREQVDCWSIHRDYAFEISPLGNGLDCHRTWEALLLNTIPIVRSCSLDPLHLEFPIVIVKDWAELNLENLQRWQTELAPQFTDQMKQRLGTEHWVKRIRQTAPQ